MTEIPRLQMGVLKAPLGKLLHHPVGRRFVVRRPGEPRPVTVGQHVQGVHHLRMLHGFLANACVHALVHRFLREHQTGGREQRERLLHDSNRIAQSRAALKRGQRLRMFRRHSYMGGQTGARVMVCLLLCDTLFAQDANKARDALEWTVALRGRMAQMSNPVVRVHGIASVARLVCPIDPVAASGLFRDAITSLFNIGTGAFGERSTTVLPVASFSGLWKYVVPAALKCDPTLSSTAQNQQARERMNAERTGANSTLGRAYGMLSPELVLDKADMLDRAAQVARGALEAGDPDTLDTDLLSRLLSRLCENAPDLSDDLFSRSLDFVMSATVPSPDSLQDLARFLFTAPNLVDESEEDQPHKSIQVNGATIEDLTATRNSANPDNIQALIESTLKLLANPTAENRNPVVAYALAIATPSPRARSHARPRGRI